MAHYTSFRGQGVSGDPQHWGQLGDYVGGLVNPVVGLATVILVFLTLLLQRHELQASLAELKRSNESAAIQSFEQSLFSWLSSYHELIGQARHDGNEEGRAAMIAWYRPNFAGQAVVVHEFMAAAGGVEALQIIDPQNLLNELEMNLPRSDERLGVLENLFRRARSQFGGVHKLYRAELEPALETLFHLVRWIDQSNLSNEQKWHYASLVGAQISWIEQAFIFYFCFDGYPQFAELVNRYALLSNLDAGNDTRHPHQFDSARPCKEAA